MAGSTDHYGLNTISSSGESFSTDGYKYTSADRQTIDTLLYLGAEAHHHDGATGAVEEPEDPLQLTLNTTGGTLPAGTRIYYKWTYLTSRGEETAAGPEAFIDTPNAISEPSAPSISYTTTGGTLQGGNYFYVLSAYVNSSIAESKALNPAYITIPATTITNEITLDLPTVPDGATGFNVYRRLPGQAKYYWLASIDTDVATPPTSYVDDGSVEEDCDRTIPKFNTTNSTNSVEVELPADVTMLPEGYTWKIYRTFIDGSWGSSFLTHVVEYTDEATPIITTTYTDVGISTTEGTYPATSLVINSPSKILLTDGAEVQGVLPLSAIAFPIQHTFQWAGPLNVEPVEGSATFICEFPMAEIVSCRAALGRGASPSSSDVIVDINKGTATSNPTYSTIFTTQANRPRVEVGDQVGSRTTPDVNIIERGESLTMDIDQIGGGATPTDRDLVVTVYMIAYGFPETSYVDGESGGTGGDF